MSPTIVSPQWTASGNPVCLRQTHRHLHSRSPQKQTIFLLAPEDSEVCDPPFVSLSRWDGRGCREIIGPRGAGCGRGRSISIARGREFWSRCLVTRAGGIRILRGMRLGELWLHKRSSSRNNETRKGIMDVHEQIHRLCQSYSFATSGPDVACGLLWYPAITDLGDLFERVRS